MHMLLEHIMVISLGESRVSLHISVRVMILLEVLILSFSKGNQRRGLGVNLIIMLLQYLFSLLRFLERVFSPHFIGLQGDHIQVGATVVTRMVCLVLIILSKLIQEEPLLTSSLGIIK
jgi:hypothetical protein